METAISTFVAFSCRHLRYPRMSAKDLAKKGLMQAKRVFERRRVCPFSCGPWQKSHGFNECLLLVYPVKCHNSILPISLNLKVVRVYVSSSCCCWRPCVFRSARIGDKTRKRPLTEPESLYSKTYWRTCERTTRRSPVSVRGVLLPSLLRS